MTDIIPEQTESPSEVVAAAGGGVRGFFERVKQWSTAKKWAIGTPVGLLMVALVLVTVDVAASWDRIHPGVRIADVSVGGLTPERAADRLEREIGDRAKLPVELVFEDLSWSVSGEDIGFAPDLDGMVDAAMEVGRSGGVLSVIGERFTAWIDPVELAPEGESDRALTDGLLAAVAREIDVPAIDASVEIEGTTARLNPASVGVSLRVSEVERDLLRAFADPESRTVEAQIVFTPVAVTDEDARQALEDARELMAGPLTVFFEDETWEFSSSEVASWIAFRAIPVDGSEPIDVTQDDDATAAADPLDSESTETSTTGGSGLSSYVRMRLEVFIEPEVASSTVMPRVGSAGRAAVDASFEVDGDSVRVVPSQDGVGPNLEALCDSILRRVIDEGERTVELRTVLIEPDITTADAEAMGIVTRIGTYSTTYSASNKPRVNNIHTLAEELDGTLVAPGEVFSFNGTIGPRTVDKGYQAAPAIVDGELVPQLGGGICQVATTIFNAVYESGLPVVERSPHSLYISHYPTGRDAAVSWERPDFKFKNDTDSWVLIRAFYTNSSIRLSLYGADLGYDVSSSTGAWSVASTHSVREVEDPTLPVGTRVVDDPGADGKRITVTRIVKKNGTEIRRDTFTSVYRSEEEVVRVGTMPVSVPTSETVDPAS